MDSQQQIERTGTEKSASMRSRRTNRRQNSIVRSTIEDVYEKCLDIEAKYNNVVELLRSSENNVDPDFLLVEELLELQEQLAEAQKTLNSVQKYNQRSRRSSAADILQLANEAVMQVGSSFLPNEKGGLFSEPQSDEDRLHERSVQFRRLREESRRKLEELVKYIDSELQHQKSASNNTTQDHAQVERQLSMIANFPAAQRMARVNILQDLTPVRRRRSRGPKLGRARNSGGEIKIGSFVEQAGELEEESKISAKGSEEKSSVYHVERDEDGRCDEDDDQLSIEKGSTNSFEPESKSSNNSNHSLSDFHGSKTEGKTNTTFQSKAQDNLEQKVESKHNSLSLDRKTLHRIMRPETASDLCHETDDQSKMLRSPKQLVAQRVRL